MAEYIDRQAAIEAIDESLKRVFVVPVGKSIMDKIPDADVRPVVLCRDCKFTKTDGMEDPAIYCEKWDRWEMPPDGFCWLGKKRKEVIDGN